MTGRCIICISSKAGSYKVISWVGLLLVAYQILLGDPEDHALLHHVRVLSWLLLVQGELMLEFLKEKNM